MATATKCLAIRLVRASLLVSAALVVFPALALATVDARTATLESGHFGEFSQTNIEQGTLALASDRAFDGGVSARATYDGSGENGYARGIWEVNWSDGEEVWFGGAYYLPVGFHSNIQGQVDLLRWDNWASHPSDTDWGGVSIYGSDRRARLLRFGAGRPNDTLVGPLELPEGRWFTLEVHQQLSSGDGALSELYVDGTLVGSSSKPNTYGRGIERIRYGIVAIAADSQQQPLELWFDRASAGPGPAGELAAVQASSSHLARTPTEGRCTTRRHSARRGRVWLRRIATTCRGERRSCRTVRIRSRGADKRVRRRLRLCVTAQRICRSRSRVVRRIGKPARRSHSHRCRARA